MSNTNKLKKDLSKVEGSYTREIELNLDLITDSFEDPDVDASSLKSIIKKIVSKANDTKARKKFLTNLESKNTKEQIIFFVSNAWLAGSCLAAI